MLAKKFLFSVLIVLFGVMIVSAAVPNPGHSSNEISFDGVQRFFRNGKNISFNPNWVDRNSAAQIASSSGMKLHLAANENGALQNHLVIDTEGDVGIGTANPSAKLEVAGYGTQVVSGGDSFIANIHGYHQPGLLVHTGYGDNVDIARFSSIGSGFVEVPRMVIKDNGAVGIGVTNPGSFQLYSYAGEGESAVRGYASADGYWGGYFTGTTHGLHARGSGYGADIYANGAGLGTGLLVRNINTTADPDVVRSQVYLATGGWGVYSKLGTNYFNESVGIGKSPSEKLDVAGTIRGNKLMVSEGSWTTNGTDIFLNTGASGQSIYLRPNGDGSTSGQAVLGSDGKLTANDFCAGTKCLSSTGGSASWDTLKDIPTDFADGVDNVGVTGGGTGGYVSKYLGAEGTTLIAPSKIYETSSGNIGIGTTSPSSEFEVSGKITTANLDVSSTINVPYLVVSKNIRGSAGSYWQLPSGDSPSNACLESRGGMIYFDTSAGGGNYAVPCVCAKIAGTWAWKPMDNFDGSCS